MDEDKNTNIDSAFNIDPDYERINKAVRQAEAQEDDDSKSKEDKLRAIIQEEFDKELLVRQKQIEEIEEKIFKAQKLLHIVRYAIISSYYNKKSLEVDVENPVNPHDMSNIFLGQNRIHPAIKKLLGNNANNYKFLGTRAKRKSGNESKTSSSNYTSAVEPKKIKLEPNSTISLSPSTSSSHISTENNASTSDEIVTKRNKVQHRIVIGNISYYKKSLGQNNLTHKWMVFVKIFKGLTDTVEVTNSMISKVVFQLHSSYKPHDFVDVCQPPFHLSRRGWGEFPLRVKIVFKSPTNKPLELVHLLKLDKTFTERQTLGNETIVPVFLYEPRNVTNSVMQPGIVDSSDNRFYTEKHNTPFTNDSDVESISNESFCDQFIGLDSIKTESTEHDYCFDNLTIKPEELDIDDDLFSEYGLDDDNISNQTVVSMERLNKDHSYSLSPMNEGQTITVKKNESPVIQDYNELVYGLGANYLDAPKNRARNVKQKSLDKMTSLDAKTQSLVKILKTVTGQTIQVLPDGFSQMLLRNGNIVSVKVLNSPESTKSSSGEHISPLKGSNGSSNNFIIRESVKKKTDYQLKFPRDKFKNMGEVLPYMFHKLPLWSPYAKESDYSRLYPFAAASEKEFFSWNVGKKLACEWSRAKTIKKLLSQEPFGKNWTTKAIFMYGRSHLYTPLVPSYRLFKVESPEKQLILDCFKCDNVPNGFKIPEHHVEDPISIVSPTKSVIDRVHSNGTARCLYVSDKRLSQECTFVKEAALDVGVLLKPEEIVNGISMNVSEQVMLEAMKMFADNLIRRARNYLICDGKYVDETSEITTAEVLQAFDERTEFHAIRQFEENRLTSDFFS